MLFKEKQMGVIRVHGILPGEYCGVYTVEVMHFPDV